MKNFNINVEKTAKNVLFDIDDICLIPATVTNIESRIQCCPNYISSKNDLIYPIFTSPMSSVVSEHNIQDFYMDSINAILPTTVNFDVRISFLKKGFWAAFSINEAFEINRRVFDNTIYICIDCANGHMERLLNLVKSLKARFGNKIVIMTGNIANPETYLDYCEAGVDYVRVGIGGGSACTTAVQTGCYCPMGSLINTIGNIKQEVLKCKSIHEKSIFSKFSGDTFMVNGRIINSIPFIVADGGFNKFDRIIKAFALGADYVMCGSILAATWESASELHVLKNENNKWVKVTNYNGKDFKNLLPSQIDELLHCPDYKVYKYYWGMSTIKAQKERKLTTLKVSEGVCNTVDVIYTLSEWKNLFDSYLRSAMSYMNCRSLVAFTKLGKTIFEPNGNIQFMTGNAQMQYKGNKDTKHQY